MVSIHGGIVVGVEDQTISDYTLIEEDGRFVIRRPDGAVVFRVLDEYERDARELLVNLNRLPKITPPSGDDDDR